MNYKKKKKLFISVGFTVVTHGFMYTVNYIKQTQRETVADNINKTTNYRQYSLITL